MKSISDQSVSGATTMTSMARRGLICEPGSVHLSFNNRSSFCGGVRGAAAGRGEFDEVRNSRQALASRWIKCPSSQNIDFSSPTTSSRTKAIRHSASSPESCRAAGEPREHRGRGVRWIPTARPRERRFTLSNCDTVAPPVWFWHSWSRSLPLRSELPLADNKTGKPQHRDVPPALPLSSTRSRVSFTGGAVAISVTNRRHGGPHRHASERDEQSEQRQPGAASRLRSEQMALIRKRMGPRSPFLAFATYGARPRFGSSIPTRRHAIIRWARPSSRSRGSGRKTKSRG